MNKPRQCQEELFEAALRLPTAERSAFLDQACAGDAELRHRVEALLGAFERAGGFMKQPASPERTVCFTLPPTEKPGDRIGRYKLLEQIGEGGCGVVYVAEQEAPVRRRVALKVIKLGMDTKQVIARFDAERQALAMMDHPNIAKIHDAGATDTGRPYFVMELVRGVKITDYCDQHQLLPRERLDLFIQVCRAIQDAHQKGVIHRDIKPSNILVTLHDGVPVPKVIDFGIAKATQGRLTDQTVYTAFEQFIGTPAYMSPEQAEMSGLDIDTRSDIYSLGVLLYELLTGKTPFDAKELLAAGLDEMRRTIREVEPVKPSTRLTRDLVAADVSPLKSHRSSKEKVRADSRRLLQEVRGDLDWIAMKCLEKDRTRRYETVNGLATDVQHHLNCEPVVARPPSKLYEFQKTVRRHKFGFAAAAALIVVLSAGVLVSTWQAVRATRAEQEQSRLLELAQQSEAKEVQLRLQANEARDQAEANKRKAETEAARSAQVAQFLKDMLKGVGPGVARGRNTDLLREILDQTADHLNNLRGQPAVEADLRATLGQVYRELGELTKAEGMFREAVRLRRGELASPPAELASVLDGLGMVLRDEAKLDEAEAVLNESLALRRGALGSGHVDTAASLMHLGIVLRSQTRNAEAESVTREALEIYRKSPVADKSDHATCLALFGTILRRSGKAQEAEAVYREAIELGKAANADGDAYIVANLAISLLEQGKLSEAETWSRKAVAMQRKLGDAHPGLGKSLNGLVMVLRAGGKLAEAEATARESLEVLKKALGEDNHDTQVVASGLADLLGLEGKGVEARTLCEQQLARLRKEHGNGSLEQVPWLVKLAEMLRRENKLTEAVAVYREWFAYARTNGAVEGFAAPGAAPRARLPAKDSQLDGPLVSLTQNLIDAHRFPEAEEAARLSLALREKIMPNSWFTFNTRSVLGGILTEQQKYAEAEPPLLSGHDGLKQREGELPPVGKVCLSNSVDRLVQLYQAWNKPDQAAEWKQKLAEFDKAEAEAKAAVPKP